MTVRRAIRLLLGLAALTALAGSAARAQDAAQAFTVNGIDVDFVGKDSMAARYAAYRHAQRQGWKMLYARLTGTPAASAPGMTDSALDAMVNGIEVEAERFSDKRYIARLGVVFDRVRAAKYLGKSGTALTSPPMLLLPVLDDGGARTVYEGRSPWLRAWARYRAGATPMQYVRADGTSGDTVLLNAYQSRRPERARWASILARYSAADVLIAEAKLYRTYPGGPVVGLFTARHGPDGTVLARFRLRTASAAGLDGLLDAGVRGIDAAYGTALREGRLRSDPGLAEALAPAPEVAPFIDAAEFGGIDMSVPTPDAATWGITERNLRSTPTVRGVRIVSLSLGGTSVIRVNATEGFDWLRYNLDQRGLRLESVPGAGLRLRRKVPGDVPIEPPVSPDAMGAAAEAVENGTATPGAVPASTPAPAVAPVGQSPRAPAPAPQQPPAGQPRGPANLLPAAPARPAPAAAQQQAPATPPRNPASPPPAPAR